MIQLRYYQEAAVLSIYDYFMKSKGNPIVAMPTGTGKSIVIAEFCRSVLTYFPTQRILMLTHVKELIRQNYDELLEVWPMAPVGIYSAGLKRREVRQITFAGIASVVKKPDIFGHIDLVIVDECHLIGPSEGSNYRSFIDALLLINLNLKVIGLSATPYRLGQGILTHDVLGKMNKAGEQEVKKALFTDVCFDITGLEAFNRLIAEGFLCTLITKRTIKQIDLTGVHIVAGEFNQDELQAAVDRDSITKGAIEEVITQAAVDGRKRWLVFATGIEHAEHIAIELRSRGIDAKCIHSKTSHDDRKKWIEEFKTEDGTIRALVNNNVLTTGVNVKIIDLIADLQPTCSPSKHVQKYGRGTRPAPGKLNCLVLDFAGNTKRLGPINDPVLPRKKGSKGGGDAPVKVCEACQSYCHCSVRICPVCGSEFPVHVKFESVATEVEIVRGIEPVIAVFKVDRVEYDRHISRSGKPDSIRASYWCGIRMFTEWVCLEHEGFAKKKAHDWWRARSPYSPPVTIDAAEPMLGELVTPSHVRVWVNQKHPQIMAHDFSGTAFGEKIKLAEINDEDVPF